MKLTRASGHAVRALVFLTRHEGDGPVSAEKIAAAEGLPRQFLGKILGQLGSAGVVRSTQGPRGGCRLARRPKDVTLLDVVEAVDDPVSGDVPRWESGAAGNRLDARLQTVCDVATDAERGQLRRVTVADLAAGGKG
jgi:Rrf2 family protein